MFFIFVLLYLSTLKLHACFSPLYNNIWNLQYVNPLMPEDAFDNSFIPNEKYNMLNKGMRAIWSDKIIKPIPYKGSLAIDKPSQRWSGYLSPFNNQVMRVNEAYSLGLLTPKQRNTYLKFGISNIKMINNKPHLDLKEAFKYNIINTEEFDRRRKASQFYVSLPDAVVIFEKMQRANDEDAKTTKLPEKKKAKYAVVHA